MKKTIISILEKPKIIRGTSIEITDFLDYIELGGMFFQIICTGDYLEFGVYRGDSLVFSLQAHYEFMIWLNSQKKSDVENSII